MQYNRVRELGRGAFGIVDLVEDEERNRFARKTYAAPDLPGVTPQELRQRFEREVRYQSQVDHPNVVRIVDYNLTDDPPWFVMELATCSLADEIGADCTLGGSPQAALFDILAGLEAIHDRGFKHRDLKPANVLKFAVADGGSRYAISDFGLMTPGAGQTSTLTATNRAGGTPLYRAPECAIDFRRATTQSDIYSVGAILHDIFGGGASRIPHTELSVPGSLGTIIQKCTKTNIKRRYKNVVALREELYDVLSTQAIEFTSRAEEEVVDLLKSRSRLSDEEWDRVCQQLEENERNDRPNHAIFRALSVEHIEHLSEDAPELLAAIGEEFAKYVQTNSFDFDYCDVLASKEDAFFRYAELDLKAMILVSLLVMGTDHNRWFVERKFMQLAGTGLDNALAERVKIELEVQGIDFDRHVSHLEWSIRRSRENLHPTLRAMLE